MIQVQAPDGSIVEFPDGTGDDVILRVMQQNFGGPDNPMQQPTVDVDVQWAQPEPAPDPNPLMLGLQGVGRGAADLVGLPVDLTTGVINAGIAGANMLGADLSPIREPVGGSDWIANKASGLAGALGVDVVDPHQLSAADNLAYNVNRFGSQALGGAQALSRLGAAAATPAADLTSQAGSALQNYIRPYAAAPARTIAGDTAAGVGTGSALSAYETSGLEGALEDTGFAPVGALFSGIAGGIGGAGLATAGHGLGNMAVRGGQRALGRHLDPNSPINPATGQPFTRAEMDQAAQYAQKAALHPGVAAAQIGDTTDDLLKFVSPGELPTVGPLSDDPGLLALETRARAQTAPQFIERDRNVAGAARDILDSSAPNVPAREFTDFATQVDDANVSAAQAARDAAAQQLRAQEQQMAQEALDITNYRGRGPAASQALDQNLVEAQYLPARAEKNQLYAEAADDRTMVPADTVIDAARTIRQQLNQLGPVREQLPAEFVQRIERLAPIIEETTVQTGILGPDGRPIARQVEVNVGGPGEVSTKDLVEVRKYLSTAYERAQQSGNFDLADNIRALRAAVNETLSGNEMFAAAEANYRDNFAPKFRAGRGDEMERFTKQVDRDPTRSTTPPSQTAGRFLRPGQPERAASLMRVMGDDTRSVRDYLLSDLAESGIVDPKTGALRPDALQKWRTERWGDVLDRVPDFRDEVDDLINRVRSGTDTRTKLGDELRKAEQGLNEVMRNKGALRLVLGKDPENAVQSIFSSGDPEREVEQLLQTIGGNQRARDGLKAAIKDYMVEKATNTARSRTNSGDRPVSFAKLDNLFAQNEKALAKAYGPEGMNKLRQVHRLLTVQETRTLRGTTGSDTAEKASQQLWRALEGGLKAKYGVLKGGGMLRTIRIFAESLPNSDQAIQDIIGRMWFDPDLAQHLLTRSVDVGGPQWNAKLNRLLSAGAAARETSD